MKDGDLNFNGNDTPKNLKSKLDWMMQQPLKVSGKEINLSAHRKNVLDLSSEEYDKLVGRKPKKKTK